MEPPNDFICPITHDVMVNPVICAFGHSYKRDAMELWLATNDTSPRNNNRLPNKVLTPNHALQNAIQEWASNGYQKNMAKLQKQLNDKEAELRGVLRDKVQLQKQLSNKEVELMRVVSTKSWLLEYYLRTTREQNNVGDVDGPSKNRKIELFGRTTRVQSKVE
jgi:hypothetical protein